jgi:hypothetical protein
MNQASEKLSKVLTGSYLIEDCEFLLQTVDIKPISVEEKERRLQQGCAHYSTMISNEVPPTPQYLNIFNELIELYEGRLASEIKLLAKKLYKAKGSSVTIVSLARAGTPIGVLLSRALKKYHTNDVKHYSVSIVRDRGIDTAALQYIADSGRTSESVIFVDGWTAKGVINHELKQAISDWNAQNDYRLGDELCVISDLSGHAEFIATTDDYAIPSGVLNSTVSGLLSRTLMLDNVEGFHQCVMYHHLGEHDLSNWFVDKIEACFDSVEEAKDSISDEWRKKRQEEVSKYLKVTMSKYNIRDINKIKPGVAEATRVMLRRVPRLLILKDLGSPDVNHLKLLAREKGIPIFEQTKMPFAAMAIIENVKE